MSSSHTESMSPDPGCGSCGGEGWVVGAEYMGAVEHIPCDCIARRCDGCEQRVERCACDPQSDEPVTRPVQTRICPVCRTVHDLPLCPEAK